MTLLRGRREGLEVTLPPSNLDEAFDELHARLSEQSNFYRGSTAMVNRLSAVPMRVPSLSWM